MVCDVWSFAIEGKALIWLNDHVIAVAVNITSFVIVNTTEYNRDNLVNTIQRR